MNSFVALAQRGQQIGLPLMNRGGISGRKWRSSGRPVGSKVLGPERVPVRFQKRRTCSSTGASGMSARQPFRVLVVDDFEPWRRFVSSIILMKSELLVVGEASDGMEAVQKAAELKPDLILLDIGLPTLNGIEAARQIRKLVPESKIIFLTQESSADVVQEALSLGALGYVVKAEFVSDFLAAVEAVFTGVSHS